MIHFTRTEVLCCVVHQKAVPVHSTRSYLTILPFDSAIPFEILYCWHVSRSCAAIEDYQWRVEDEDAAADRVKAEHGSVVHHFGCARLFDVCTILIVRSLFSCLASRRIVHDVHRAIVRVERRSEISQGKVMR